MIKIINLVFFMYYNLYYNNEIINNTPVDETVIEKLNTKDYVFKVIKNSRKKTEVK